MPVFADLPGINDVKILVAPDTFQHLGSDSGNLKSMTIEGMYVIQKQMWKLRSFNFLGILFLGLIQEAIK